MKYASQRKMQSNIQIAAAVQFAPELLNVRKNLETARHLAFEAAAKGAAIVVLPELCMSGFVLNTKREAADCCQQKNGYQTAAMQKIAEVTNCHIVFGYVELNEGKLYNSAAIVGPTGLVANVQKHNLFGSDMLWSEASECMAPVVITRAGRLGALICRDITNNFRQSYKFYNPLHRFYKKGSVDTIALPTNWGEKFGYPDASWVELVEEVDCNLVIANRVGIERDMHWKGGSAIVDRSRKVWTHGSNFTHEAVVGGAILL